MTMYNDVKSVASHKWRPNARVSLSENRESHHSEAWTSSGQAGL